MKDSLINTRKWTTTVSYIDPFPARNPTPCLLWSISVCSDLYTIWQHARTSDVLENFLNLGGTTSERMTPELILGVLDQLNEGDEQSPLQPDDKQM
jgi:hypothetical protein